jgi:hypothetical protein
VGTEDIGVSTEAMDGMKEKEKCRKHREGDRRSVLRAAFYSKRGSSIYCAQYGITPKMRTITGHLRYALESSSCPFGPVHFLADLRIPINENIPRGDIVS